MKILFVSPSLEWTDSAAIAILSSVAKENGHQTYYTHLDMGTDAWIKIIQSIEPRIIAYSTNTGWWNLCVKRNKQARKFFNFFSIAGGSHPTQCPDCFDSSGMDALCVGEGEGAWEDFIKAVDEGKPFYNIANIIAWDRNRRKKINQVRPYIENLDLLPMPDRDLILGTTFLHSTEKKTFLTSRGCPFQCTYCQNDTWKKIYKGKGELVRRFSPERVIREMEIVMAKHRMDFVKIADDCFAKSVDDWLKEFCDKYRARIGLPFNCLLRLDHINNDLLRILKDAGCYSLHLSVDSTNPTIRENVLNRKYDNDDIIKKLLLINQHGIHTWVNFMLAIPGSTMRDDLDTIAFARKSKVTYASYTTTIPTPGTALFRNCEEQNLLPSGIGDFTGEIFHRPSILNCFSKRRKKASYNVLLLGAVLAKLPAWLSKIGEVLLPYIPNLYILKKIRGWGLEHAVTKTIYKIK